MSRMRLTLLFLLVLGLTLAVVPAMAEEVTFTCVVTGSDNDGFDILATNNGPNDKKCKATCTVTKKDGSKQSWEYSGTVRAVNAKQNFGGEAGVPGAPLKDPKITSQSCE